MTLRESFAEFGMENLLRWVAESRPPLNFERSLRLQPDTVEIRRCLFSFPTAALGNSAVDEVLQICRLMSSPEQQLTAIQRFFRGAEHVHFGFEYSGDTAIGKCYLELADSGPEASETARLKFLGYKWSMNDPSVAVVSRYRTLAVKAWANVAETMQQQVSADLRPAMSQLLGEFQPATDGVETAELNLLEVEEEGSNRRSYDLNVYAVEHTVADVERSIRAVAAALHCNMQQLDQWAADNRDATVGHVAVGQNRVGLPFLTIYHSADIKQLILK